MNFRWENFDSKKHTDEIDSWLEMKNVQGISEVELEQNILRISQYALLSNRGTISTMLMEQKQKVSFDQVYAKVIFDESVEEYVGVAVLSSRITKYGDECHIARLIVKPDLQCRGYGSMIVEDVLMHAPELTDRHEKDNVSICVDISNARCMAMCEKMGFMQKDVVCGMAELVTNEAFLGNRKINKRSKSYMKYNQMFGDDDIYEKR